MSAQRPFELYSGDGKTLAERSLELPLFERIFDEDPAGYRADDSLRDAVNVALALGLPLLLTGKPGTGKTQLAASLAHQLGLPAPLRFDVKTTSTAKDLFYRYDTLAHFHDSQFHRRRPEVESYITYEALGLAILLSREPLKSNPFLPARLRGRGPLRSVVLIDEIDKAPRDLPNDVLNEIESMSFTVQETGRTFSADPRYRPILVLTSNSEKNLPDAFLRRCAFYHIPRPSDQKLVEIIQQRLRLGPGSDDGGFTSAMVNHALKHFERIRQLDLKKEPSTAELLAWIHLLRRLRIDVDDVKPGQEEALLSSYSVLVKTEEDLTLLLREHESGRV